jgi:shikimate kinase
MKSAPNLVLVGPMGAGKTSIGRRLAERLGLRFADADHDLELRAGASVTTIFDCEGEAGFRARERTLLAELLAGEGLLVATGGGAVLDAENRALLRARGFVVWLHASVETQLRRLAHDRSRPLLQRDDREAALRQLAAQRAALYAEVAELRLATDHLSPAQACDALADSLATRWRRGDAASAPQARPA